MKKLFIIIISLLIASIKLTAATRKSSSKNSRRVASKVKLPPPNEMQCRENIDYCFNYYCFDKKTLTDGVYSKCGSESASKISINVNDCLDTRGIIKNLDLKDGCLPYTYNYIVALLGNKDIIETALKKQTTECSEATVALDAAKACWAKMIAHDGSIDSSLRTQLVALCGYAKSKDTDMVDRFYHAGDYGDSNIAAQMDMELTGQNTKKRENWRQVVDGILAGYMEMAELACGEEDYDITKVNDYIPDSRTNLAMVRAQAQADEMGRATANRIVNSWFRKTDCLNSPLPKGGLRWEYIEDGAPDCRIVCLDGYTEGNNSSECIEKKDTIIAFGGFVNTEVAYVGEPSITPTQEQTYIPTDNYNPFTEKEYDNTDNNNYPQSKVCSKSTLNKRTYGSIPPTKREICKVFFPDCASGKLGRMRWYERNTDKPSDEFFCLGDDYNKTHTFDFWINLTLADINNAFTTQFKQFGDDYEKHASEYIKKQCPSICGNGTKSNTKKANNTTPVSNANTQTNSSTCDLDIESSVDYEVQKQWDNYLASYNGNCQTEKNNLLTTLNAYRNPAGVGNNRYGPSASDVIRIMNNMKQCVCYGKTSTTNTSSNSSDYAKQIKKACEQLEHKGRPIKNNEQKMKYCTETILPAYCKPNLSSDQLKRCIDTFLMPSGVKMSYYCTSKASFNKCVWSRKFDPTQWDKSWYKYAIDGKSQETYLIFNKYNVYYDDTYDELPFTDWDELFP
ncbi:hypothetical protein HDR59_03960 [bacterium]|nr:hypothetical protein [bacterium]